MSQAHLDLAVQAAQAAGAILREGFGRPVEVLSAQGKDIKTGSDHAAERVILSRLADSGLPVLTEETGLHPGAQGEGEVRWVVDPLDGTLNYVRGLPLCCVSIALWRGNEPVLGVIHEFLHNRLYSGLVGQGASCNGRTLAVSTVPANAQAVIATGFPASSDFGDAPLLGFVRRVQQFKKVRLLGSAALSLAHVAEGSVDVYAENGIHFWDVAAGLALVRAAGGDYQMSPRDSAWRCNVTATNGRLPQA